MFHKRDRSPLWKGDQNQRVERKKIKYTKKNYMLQPDRTRPFLLKNTTGEYPIAPDGYIPNSVIRKRLGYCPPCEEVQDMVKIDVDVLKTPESIGSFELEEMRTTRIKQKRAKAKKRVPADTGVRGALLEKSASGPKVEVESGKGKLKMKDASNKSLDEATAKMSARRRKRRTGPGPSIASKSFYRDPVVTDMFQLSAGDEFDRVLDDDNRSISYASMVSSSSASSTSGVSKVSSKRRGKSRANTLVELEDEYTGLHRIIKAITSEQWFPDIMPKTLDSITNIFSNLLLDPNVDADEDLHTKICDYIIAINRDKELNYTEEHIEILRESLRPDLKSQSDIRKINALRGLAELNTKDYETINDMVMLLNDPNEDVKGAAEMALLNLLGTFDIDSLHRIFARSGRIRKTPHEQREEMRLSLTQMKTVSLLERASLRAIEKDAQARQKYERDHRQVPQIEFGRTSRLTASPDSPRRPSKLLQQMDKWTEGNTADRITVSDLYSLLEQTIPDERKKKEMMAIEEGSRTPSSMVDSEHSSTAHWTEEEKDRIKLKLIEMLSHEEPAYRLNAVKTLIKLGLVDATSAPDFVPLLADKNEEVKQAAERAIQQAMGIGDRDQLLGLLTKMGVITELTGRQDEADTLGQLRYELDPTASDLKAAPTSLKVLAWMNDIPNVEQLQERMLRKSMQSAPGKVLSTGNLSDLDDMDEHRARFLSPDSARGCGSGSSLSMTLSEVDGMRLSMDYGSEGDLRKIAAVGKDQIDKIGARERRGSLKLRGSDAEKRRKGEKRRDDKQKDEIQQDEKQQDKKQQDKTDKVSKGKHIISKYGKDKDESYEGISVDAKSIDEEGFGDQGPADEKRPESAITKRKSFYRVKTYDLEDTVLEEDHLYQPDSPKVDKPPTVGEELYTDEISKDNVYGDAEPVEHETRARPPLLKKSSSKSIDYSDRSVSFSTSKSTTIVSFLGDDDEDQQREEEEIPKNWRDFLERPAAMARKQLAEETTRQRIYNEYAEMRGSEYKQKTSGKRLVKSASLKSMTGNTLSADVTLRPSSSHDRFKYRKSDLGEEALQRIADLPPGAELLREAAPPVLITEGYIHLPPIGTLDTQGIRVLQSVALKKPPSPETLEMMRAAEGTARRSSSALKASLAQKRQSLRRPSSDLRFSYECRPGSEMRPGSTRPGSGHLRPSSSQVYKLTKSTGIESINKVLKIHTPKIYEGTINYGNLEFGWRTLPKKLPKVDMRMRKVPFELRTTHIRAAVLEPAYQSNKSKVKGQEEERSTPESEKSIDFLVREQERLGLRRISESIYTRKHLSLPSIPSIHSIHRLPADDMGPVFIWQTPLPPVPSKGLSSKPQQLKDNEHYCEYYDLVKKRMNEQISLLNRHSLEIIREKTQEKILYARRPKGITPRSSANLSVVSSLG